MRKWVSKIAVTMVTIVLMLLTCEVATRLFARVAQTVSQRDPLIGRRFPPNMSEYIYDPEADAPVFFQTNQLGFRGSKFSLKKPPGICRVAVLGDSYTASMALAEEETFCHQLQILLNLASNVRQKWEVLNFGMHGAGTGQELALYRNVVKGIEPDVVVVAFSNGTDVRDNSRELSSNPIIQFELGNNGKLVQIPQSHGRVRASNLLNRFSRFYAWQKMKTNSVKQLIHAQAELEIGPDLIYAADEPESYTNAWRLTSAILETWRDECRGSGTRLMVTAIPSACQVYLEFFADLESRGSAPGSIDPLHPDGRLRQICNDLSIPFQSLTVSFRDHAPSQSRDVETEHLFIDGRYHLNAQGSRVAASVLSSWILESQVASRPVDLN